MPDQTLTFDASGFGFFDGGVVDKAGDDHR
jgi:hypothetical protein